MESDSRAHRREEHVISHGLERALRNEGKQHDASDDVIKGCRDIALKILRDLKKANPRQHALAVDDAPYSAGICPRRAGKSYLGSCLAMITGLAKPGAISIVVSLNLKQLRRLYWTGGPSGLFTIARKYGIKVEWRSSMLSWELPNGSIGYLMGADDDEQLEVLRGLEADLYLIDECKSFAPSRLRKIIDELIEPQRASRKGRVVLIGTPGHIAAGPFWEATCPLAKDELGRPFHVDFGSKDPWKRTPQKDRIWSRHHWTLEDNSAMAHQWTEALITKEKKRYTDDDPVWRREYLGEWVSSNDGLVYRYAAEYQSGRVSWTPQPTTENPTGLPEEGAPWRFVAGMDLGFEDKTAIVVAAYSSRLRQLRQVYEFAAPHMLVDDVADLLSRVHERYAIEKVFVDAGNLGKMVVESLIRRGFPLERAEKREKYDHIELLNSAIVRGEVQIIDGSELHQQLLTVAWDLRDEEGSRGRTAVELLAHVGRLRENDEIPNDLTDALLYLYRGSLHQFGGATPSSAPLPGTPEWVKMWERDQLRKARMKPSDRLGEHANHFTRAPTFVRRALTETDRWNLSTSTHSRRFSV